MLKKLLISLGIISIISFTSCGGGSSKEAKELLSKILQFIGIPHSIVVNVCQDSNRDGICGAKELFTKLTIQKGESIDDIWEKISLTEDGRYFLENVDPNLPILVEMQDEAKVNQDEGKFTLEFNAFKNREQNETKEISILQSMVDADALTTTEADKFRTLNNQEAQDKYYTALLNSLETNINTLRANELDSQKSVRASLKEMADEIKANQAQGDKINDCGNDQTCVDKEIKKVAEELLIDEDEELEITGTKKSNQETNTIATEPTPSPTTTQPTPIATEPTPTPTPTPIKGEEVVYGKWVKPSQSSCESSGGSYNKNNSDECRANWENANTICQAMGDKLPNLETLGAVVTDCGGDFVSRYNDNHDNGSERIDKNIANESYKACYKEKGFTSRDYWSSTTLVSDSSGAWFVSFYNGSDGWYSKTDETRVRCVRGGQ